MFLLLGYLPQLIDLIHLTLIDTVRMLNAGELHPLGDLLLLHGQLHTDLLLLLQLALQFLHLFLSRPSLSLLLLTLTLQSSHSLYLMSQSMGHLLAQLDLLLQLHLVLSLLLKSLL